MNMAADSTARLYLCPICDAPFRGEDDCRHHITNSKNSGHSGVNGFKMDRPLDVRVPEIEEKPITEWRKAILQTADTLAEDGEVDYGEVADHTETPKPFAARVLEHDSDLTPAPRRGFGRVNMEWDDLNQNQKDTLLAWAFFPEHTHRELAEMALTGHEYQGTVSRTVRDYGWMFSHPEIDTPIAPTPEHGGSEGTITTEGEVEAAMQHIGDSDAHDAQDRTAAQNDEHPTDEYVCDNCGKGFDNQMGLSVHEGRWCDADTDAATGEEPESTDTTPEPDPAPEPEPEPTAVLDGGVAVLDEDTAFETIAALIETGRYDAAESVFLTAVRRDGEGEE